MFSKTEMSEVLTEIMKMDPNFTQEGFMLDCQNDIIPNVLEGIVRGDLDILQDWCHEGAFNVLAHPIRTAHAANYIIDNKELLVLTLGEGKLLGLALGSLEGIGGLTSAGLGGGQLSLKLADLALELGHGGLSSLEGSI